MRHPERLHPGPGHRPDCRRHGSRARHLLLADGGVPEDRRRRSSRADPNVDALMSTVGGTGVGHARRPELRPTRRSSEAARRAQAARQRHHRRTCGPSLPTFPACRSTCRTRPPSASAGRSPRACTSSPCSRPIRRSCTPKLANCKHEVAKIPGLQDVTSDLADLRAAGRRHHRSRQSRLHASQRAADRKRVLRCLRSRWVSTIYASINEYKVLLELEPKYQADPNALSLLYFKSATNAA